MARKGRKREKTEKRIEVLKGVKIKIDEIDKITVEVYDEGYRKLGKFKLKDLKEKGLL